jgi:hypothetical protein
MLRIVDQLAGYDLHGCRASSEANHTSLSGKKPPIIVPCATRCSKCLFVEGMPAAAARFLGNVAKEQPPEPGICHGTAMLLGYGRRIANR